MVLPGTSQADVIFELRITRPQGKTMRNTLLLFLSLKVKGLSICLLVTLMFAASALGQMGQTEIANAAAPPIDAGKNGSAVFSSDAKEKREKPAEAQTQLHNTDDLKRWALSIHAGVSIPHGHFSDLFNPGPNLAFDVEYRISRTFSLEGIYGYHRFRGQQLGIFKLADINLHELSVNGKVYGGGSSTRPFLNFGGGAYVFSPGSDVHGGLNVGGGVQHDISPGFAVEGIYKFHNIFTSGSNTRFSTVQGGVRFRF
jgi:opacity protein-like surface antigen